MAVFLSRFRVRGYKCLHDVEVQLTPIHVLVGPSGGGKTSLLDALGAFFGRLKTPPSAWFPPAIGSELVTHGSPSPTVDLAGEWSQAAAGDEPRPLAGYGFSIFFPPKGACGVCSQWVRPLAAGVEPPVLTPHAVAYPPPRPIKTDGRRAEAAFREVMQKALAPARRFHFDPKAIAQPAAAARKGPTELESDGRGLAAVLAELRASAPETFRRVEERFRSRFGHYREIVLRETAIAVPGGRRAPAPAHALEFATVAGETVRAEHVSGGALLFLALAMLLEAPQPLGILLIEYPERTIYPKDLSELLQPLRQCVESDESPIPQAILTTHSPQVLDGFRPEEVTYVARPSGGATFTQRLSQVKAITDRWTPGRVSLGEIWYNLAEEEMGRS